VGIVRPLLGLLAILVAAPAAAQETSAPPLSRQKPIPVEAFAALPFISDPALSPDGRRIAAKASVDGKSVIAVFDVPTAPDRKPLVLSSGDASFRWAGNERLLITRSSSFALLNVPFHAFKLMSHNLVTGATIQLASGLSVLGDGVLFADPHGRYILRAKQPNALEPPEVVRVDLTTGIETAIQPAIPNVWFWHVDSQGVVRAGVEYNETGMALHYRRSADEPLKRIEARRYFEDKSVIDAIRFLDDTDSGFVISNARTGRFGVYRYDFLADRIVAPVWEHAEVDAAGVIAGEGGELDGVLFVDDRTRVHWLDPEAAKVQQTIDRALAGKVNLIAGTSDDRSKVLVWSGAANDPGTYYIFHRKTRRLEAFASPYEQLDGARLAPVQTVRYPARDGLTIRGYLTLPVDRPPSRLPLIALPHGGPFLRDAGDFDSTAQFLASRGYAVLQPNFRGSTGYGRDFVERGYGQWGTGMIDDIDAGVDWLVAQGIVDRGRVCILGASYGGYAALWAAIRTPQRYRCAISMAGISDVREMLKYDSKLLVAKRYAKDWAKQVRGEEKQDLKAISPLHRAKDLQVPVFIAHGELDTNVPASQSRKLVSALRKRRKPAESVFYPNSGHSFGNVEDSVDFLKRVETFLARHNPADQ
jgi:dipeptidyl aminopeptidase/acylaminoacyl peptidase